jgi:hypothetical protein
MILQKGLDYNAEYTSPDYPILVPGWVGTTSFYTAYPGTAAFVKTLVLTSHAMMLNLTVADILGLTAGVYSVVTVISNPDLGTAIGVLEHATVSDINISSTLKTKIFGTIEKSDGTPTGSPTSNLVNTPTGTMLQTGWKGVEVKASIAVADVDSGKIVGVETVTTQTNDAGYFELYVIKGLSVIVTCTSFGKSVSVATAGLTEIDISTFF